MKSMLCNHSYQSLKAEVFFPFSWYRIGDLPQHFHDLNVPYDIQLHDASSKFNLILNAKFNSRTWLFLMKKPIYLKQKMLCKNAHSYEYFQINEAFTDLCDGYFKVFQEENNIEIPLVISTIIKSYIEFGPAKFYCKGFQSPLFGVKDKQFTYYDSA